MKKLFLIAMLLVGTLGAKAEDNISATLKVASDLNTATLHVSLTNDQKDYVAFQMDVTLPEGWTVTGATPVGTDRLKDGGSVTINSSTESTNFVLAYNVLNNNIVRVIGYNLGNHTITGKAGEIYTIELTKTAGTAAKVTDWVATFSGVDFVTVTDLEEIALAVANVNKQAVGESEESWLMGDVNHDKSVTLGDAIATLKYVLYDNDVDAYKAATGKDFYPAQADVNGKDGITLADAIAILKLAL